MPLDRRSGPLILGYLVAVVAASLAVFGRYLSLAWFERSPVMLFIIPVLLAGALGGVRPALFAIALGVAANVWFYLHSGDTGFWFVTGLYLLTSLTVALLFSITGRQRLRLEEEQARLRIEIEQRSRHEIEIERLNAELSDRVQALRTQIEVTEQTRVQLRDNESQLRFLTDNIPVLLCQFDGDCRYLFVNRPYAERFGRTPADVVGRRLPEVIGAAAFEQLRPNVQRVLAGETHEFDAELDYDVLGRQSVHAAFVPRIAGDGRQDGFIASIINISDRKRAEGQLRFHARLLDTVNQAAIATDPEGRVLYLNRFAETLYGWSRDEISGKFIDELTVPQPGSGEATSITAQLQSGEAWSGEFTVRRHDGSTFPAFVVNTPVFSDDHVLEAIIGISTDITERKRIEEDRLEADRRKDEFLAILAHELRNPLAPILSGLQIMRLAEHDIVKHRQVREMMERQVAQLVRLIDDLLDVSRVTSNRLELRKQRVSVSKAIGSAVETVKPLAEAAGHVLAVTVADDTLHVDADFTRLAQMISNLLSNAIKYTPNGGRINVDARSENSQVVIAVSDNGIGIREELLPMIFDMFFQADRASERAQSGLGIGLTLVKRLAEMHGGNVEAQSAGQNQGSRFVLSIPQLIDPHAVSVPQQNNSRASGGKLQIVIADDNQDAADSLSMMLRLVGHETRVGYDGMQALQLANERTPDVLLLDIGMPRLNGYDVASRVRMSAWGQDVLMIALTGWGQDKDKARTAAAGFDHHLTKPVDTYALISLLDEYAGVRNRVTLNTP